MTVNIRGRSDIARATVAKQVETYRSGRAVARDMVKRFDALARELAVELQRINPTGAKARWARNARIQKLDTAISKAIKGYVDDVAKILGEPYAQALLESAGFATDVLNTSLGTDAVRPVTRGLAEVRDLLEHRIVQGVPDADFWRAHADSIRTKFLTGVRSGVKNGLRPDQIMQTPQVSRQLGIVRNQLQSRAETAIATAANEGANVMYTRAAAVGIVDGVEHIAVLDSRTCKKCGPMDGRVWGLVDGVWTGRGHDLAYGPPPSNTHYRCRCTVLPTLVDWSELPDDVRDQVPPAMRASVGGPVAATKTHTQWVNDLKDDELKAIFGRKLAAKLKAGKAKLSNAVKDPDFADALPRLTK